MSPPVARVGPGVLEFIVRTPPLLPNLPVNGHALYCCIKRGGLSPPQKKGRQNGTDVYTAPRLAIL